MSRERNDRWYDICVCNSHSDKTIKSVNLLIFYIWQFRNLKMRLLNCQELLETVINVDKNDKNCVLVHRFVQETYFMSVKSFNIFHEYWMINNISICFFMLYLFRFIINIKLWCYEIENIRKYFLSEPILYLEQSANFPGLLKLQD